MLQNQLNQKQHDSNLPQWKETDLKETVWDKYLHGRERVGSTEQHFGVRLQQFEPFLGYVHCATIISTGPGWLHTYLSSLMAPVKALTLFAGWGVGIYSQCRRTQDSLLEPCSHVLLFCIGPQSSLWDICPGKSMFSAQHSHCIPAFCCYNRQNKTAPTGFTRAIWDPNEYI